VTRRELLLRSIVLGAGLLVGLLMAEAGLRVLAASGTRGTRGFQLWDPLAVKIEPHGELGYRQKPGTELRYPNGTVASANALGYRGPAVAVPKPAGTVRVVLLGESTTHGWYVDDTATIDTYMRRLLAERYPGRRWEVVNLAYDGYDAYQLFERLRSDGLALDPDLVIANTGINDVRNARFPDLRDKDRRTQIWAPELDRLRAERERGGPTLWNRLKHYSYLARLPGVIAMRRQGRASVRRRLDVSPNLQALDYFERNLGRVAELAAPLGTPILFSTPPSLLAGAYDPAALAPRDYWIVDLPTTQRLRDSLASRMESLTRRLAAAGRRVAYRRPDLPPELFLDDCHLTPQGNERLARNFVDALPALLPDSLFAR
jgi:lysophospholipase L1-like esterase